MRPDAALARLCEAWGEGNMLNRARDQFIKRGSAKQRQHATGCAYLSTYALRTLASLGVGGGDINRGLARMAVRLRDFEAIVAASDHLAVASDGAGTLSIGIVVFIIMSTAFMCIRE